MPNWELPAGSCDCHAQVFGPQGRFPYLPNAGYIFEEAPVERYVAMLRVLGCARAVLVQPSVYGTDNACLLDALTRAPLPMRGIAVVEPGISDRELHRLHHAGVRGVRINAMSKSGELTLADAPALAPRLRELGWHLQIYVRIAETEGLFEQLKALPITCVIDHFGLASAVDGVLSKPFQSLLALAQLEHVWFKLMGACAASVRTTRNMSHS